MTKTGPSAPNRRQRLAVLITAAVMLGLPLLVTAINKVLQPQRHAEAARCLDGAVNQCNMAVMAAYCVRGRGADRNQDRCQLQRLAPGERFTTLPDAVFDSRLYTMACKAPFVPKWGPSLSNPGIQQKRCARPAG